MKLTDSIIKAAKPKDKTYKLGDGDGLWLEIPPNQSKRWRYRYTFNSKEGSLSLGTYPDVPLKEARQKCEQFNELKRKGVNPSHHNKTPRQKSKWQQKTPFKLWLCYGMAIGKNQRPKGTQSRCYDV